MSRVRRTDHRALRWEALLVVLPVLALVVFGFLALRWERQAQEEDLRTRCRALIGPMRSVFFEVLEANNLLEGVELGPRPDGPPLPGEPSDSLAKFEAGEFATVLGEAGARSQAGLPLRPLAAYRLIGEETDPERLAELVEVMAGERSVITPRLLTEAEARFQELGLKLPPGLEGWRERLANEERVRKLLGGEMPWTLLDERGPVIGLEDGKGETLLARVPGGIVLVDERVLDAATDAALLQYSPRVGVDVPGTVSVGLEGWSNRGRALPEAGTSGVTIVRDDAFPGIVFATGASDLARFTGRRQRILVIFLASAAMLAVAGLFLIRRTVARERELAERKGNLVAAVSHEMRTPVASIRLLAENLLTGAADSEERRRSHLERLGEQSERLSTLVENVLRYARREAGKEEGCGKELHVPELVGEVLRSHETWAEERGVALEQEVKEFARAPRGDREALGHALANLIDNALKHSPGGGVVRCGAGMEGADRWWLWVEDQGPGVAEEEREKIFEAFYRVGSELRRETTGTGLGLALVKQVAEQHGGEVSCREASGGGGRFELILPLDPSTLKGKGS